jgi:hypothetical protein
MSALYIERGIIARTDSRRNGFIQEAVSYRRGLEIKRKK